MELLRDHPIVENMERTGWPDGEDPAPFDCPCCEASLSRNDVIYRSRDGEILGCGNCVYSLDAQEAFDSEVRF